MGRKKTIAAVTVLLTLLSLTACSRKSGQAAGGELEDGVSAIENAMTTQPAKSAVNTAGEDLREGTSRDTVPTPEDFPKEYNYGTGRIRDYSRSAMLAKLPEPKGNETVLNTPADPKNIQVLCL